MKRLIVAAAAILALVLAGCGGPPAPTKGTVEAKYYQPAYEQWFPVLITTGCGKYGCSYTTIMVPYEVSQSWNVVLKDCNTKGKCRTGTVGVSATRYGQLSVGQYVNLRPVPRRKKQVGS